MSETCGQYKPLYSPRNVFFSCVIAQYFISFLFEHTVNTIVIPSWSHQDKPNKPFIGLISVVKRYFFSGLITGKGIVISCFVTKSKKYKLFFSDFQNVEIIGC